MTCQVDVDVLSRSLVLRALPRPELQQLAAAMRPRLYRRGEVVFHQDDPGQTLHLVCRGHLKIVRCSQAGAEAVLAIVGPSDLFGEMALLDGGPRSATVVALEPVETATLHRTDLLELLRRSPAAVEGLLAALVGTIRKASESAADLMFLDQPGRLAKKLAELAETHGRRSAHHQVEIEIPLTQDELAAMIGATRTRVNRLLSFYEAQGIVALGRRRIVIRDSEALRRRAIA
jgi:CRP/FNR family transcriptional regulator/CRP/FNR family cyclic AMP-dependent transcriptional regulator